MILRNRIALIIFALIAIASDCLADDCQQAYDRAAPETHGGEWALSFGCPDVEPKCVEAGAAVDVVEIQHCNEIFREFELSQVGANLAPEPVKACQSRIVRKLYKELYTDHYERFIEKNEMGRIEYGIRCTLGLGNCPTLILPTLCPKGKKPASPAKILAPEQAQAPLYSASSFLIEVRNALAQIVVIPRLVDYFTNRVGILLSTEASADAQWRNELNTRTAQDAALMMQVLTSYQSWEKALSESARLHKLIKTRQVARTTHIAGLLNALLDAIGVVHDNYLRADLDHDGDLDVVLFDSGTRAVYVYLRLDPKTLNRTAAFVQPVSGAASLQVTDMNGDGHPDVVISLPAQVIVLLGDGTGKFRLRQNSANAYFTANYRSLSYAQFNAVRVTCSTGSFVGTELAYENRPNGIPGATLTQQSDHKGAQFVINAFRPNGLFVLETLIAYSNTPVEAELLTESSYHHSSGYVSPQYPKYSCLVSFGEKPTDQPIVECGSDPDFILQFIEKHQLEVPHC